MSEKTVISCDISSCCEEYEHRGGDFLLADLSGWIYDQENEFHYCPNCAQGVMDDLDDAGRDYSVL